jgi:dienelactone hydrolase
MLNLRPAPPLTLAGDLLMGTALLLGLLLAAPIRAEEPPATLPGTRPLTMEGDLAQRLVEGVDRFLLRKIEEAPARREAFWRRDLASADAYNGSIASNRRRLAHILGVRDPRVPFDGFELVGTTRRSSKLGAGRGFEVHAVRWPAVDGVTGEGLLLVPESPRADIIALPDADQTPEQLVGLTPGVPPAEQFARRLAENGCRVLVPTLIDRTIAPRNGRAQLTNREYLYRTAYELGRHLLGYESQKILAAVDEFQRDRPRPVGVIGWGEGGWLALLAGALDPRIDAVAVSGAFGDAHLTWRQPIERNVFGLLEQFGDGELAAMIAPRGLIVEEARAPKVQLKSGAGGAPGRLATPEPDRVRSEFAKAQALVPGLIPEGRWALITGSGRVPDPPGRDATLAAFLAGLGIDQPPAAIGPLPTAEQALADPESRQRRQVAEIDRHTQRLLVESPYVRREYFQGLDTSSLERFQETIRPYRDQFRDEIIGRFDDPFLAANPRSRRVFDEPKFSGYEVVLDVWPDVMAYGLLLIPKGIPAGQTRPVVVCQHGLEGRPRDVADPSVNNKAYNQFAVTLAERGFVTFAPQNLYLGGDRFRTLQRKANPLKATLFSIIVPQHQVITDWLKTQPYVDPNRIAFYGLSYGGKSAMRIPPLVENYRLSICSADFNDWVWKNASTRSPYSYVWTGEYEIFEFDLGSTFNYAEMAALIAPRPFMVERGHFDGVAPDEAVAHEFAKVRFLYNARLKLPPDRCVLEFFDGPHTIHGVGTFAFLSRHLDWPEP